MDQLPVGFDVSLLSAVAEYVVSTVASRSAGIALPTHITSIPAAPSTITGNSKIIDKAYEIVAQEISGTVNLTSEDKELVSLFERYAGTQRPELTSSLHELNDKSAPTSGRVTAKQRIKKFLIDCTGKVTDMSLQLLQQYIESKVLGNT